MQYVKLLALDFIFYLKMVALVDRNVIDEIKLTIYIVSSYFYISNCLQIFTNFMDIFLKLLFPLVFPILALSTPHNEIKTKINIRSRSHKVKERRPKVKHFLLFNSSLIIKYESKTVSIRTQIK